MMCPSSQFLPPGSGARSVPVPRENDTARNSSNLLSTTPASDAAAAPARAFLDAEVFLTCEY